MDELYVRSPQAHEHVARTDPDLHESISGSLLRLAHQGLLRSRGLNDIEGNESFEPTPEAEYSPQQSVQQELNDRLVIESARLTSQAATQLEGEDRSLIHPDEAIDRLGRREVLVRAKFIALEEAKDLKNKGFAPEARQALQTMLAIGLIQEKHERDGREIREAVAEGLAKELLSAAQGMDGIVSQGNPWEGSTSVPQMFFMLGNQARHADLLRVATKMDFDNDFQNQEHFFTSGNGQRYQEILGELDYASLTALARSEKRYFPVSAANLAIKALSTLANDDKTYRCKGHEAAETIVIAADYSQQAKDSSLERERQIIMDQLRARRVAGLKPYRINQDITFGLDRALVQLATEGRLKEAKELISSTRHEISSGVADQSKHPTSNLDHIIDDYEALSGADRESFRASIRQLNTEKAAQLRAHLVGNGASTATIDNIIERSDDPDSTVGIEPTFWITYEKIRNDSEAIRDLIEGRETSHLLETSQAVDAFLKAGIEIEQIDNRIVRSLGRVEGQPAKNKYLSELAEVSRAIGEYFKDRPDEARRTRKEVLLGNFSEFASPKHALVIAQRMYGDRGVGAASELVAIFADMQSYQTTLSEINPKIEEIINCVITNGTNPEKLLKPSFIKDYLVSVGIEKVNELFATINGTPELAKLSLLSRSTNLEQHLVVGNIEAEAQELRDVYVSTGLKAVIDSLGESPLGQQALVARFLSRPGVNTFRSNAERIVGLYESMSFLREAGLNINFSGHIEDWERFLSSIPAGKAGEIIKQQAIARLSLDISEDPAQAISIFTELEVDKTSVQLMQEKGIELIRKLIGAESTRGFPSGKANKIGEIFFDEELAELYRELYDFKLAGDMEGVAWIISNHDLEPDYNLSREILRDLITEIKTGVAELQKEKRAISFWLHEYSGQDIKAAKLIEAWRARRQALSFAVNDNPKDILHFSATRGVDLFAGEAIDAGKTDISREEYEAHKEWVIKGIGSRYASSTTFQAIERVVHYLREKGNYPAKLLEAQKDIFEVNGKEFSAEILALNDPRGFTIGYDTGCCMTLTGDSKSCIWAGYEDPRYSFFAVYDEGGKLRAQSVMYIAEDEGKKILVVDNIEANAGTDLGPIAEIYRKALTQFVEAQGLDLNAIHVGVGYTPDEIISNLPDAIEKPQTPLEGTYSDAKFGQKILWTR